MPQFWISRISKIKHFLKLDGSGGRTNTIVDSFFFFFNQQGHKSAITSTHYRPKQKRRKAKALRAAFGDHVRMRGEPRDVPVSPGRDALITKTPSSSA